MRVSDSMNYMSTKLALNKNRSEMADIQTQAASQKKVNKPSDDPVGSTKLLSSKTESNAISQFEKTLNHARSFLDFSDQALSEMTENLNRAKELALSQANDPSSSEITRKAVATEIRQIYNQVLQIANRKLGNRFIFGGFDTTTKPFDRDGTYKGDKGEMLVEINKGSFISVNLPGDTIFLGRDAKKAGVISTTPKDQTELIHLKSNGATQDEENSEATLRGPASGVGKDDLASEQNVYFEGVDVFKVLSNLETGLVSNDKEAIQDTLEQIDSAIEQVIHSRSKIDARVQNLDSIWESLEKSAVDEEEKQASIEDADAYELFSKMSQNEATLKAVMSASAKILQPSLLDFLR